MILKLFSAFFVFLIFLSGCSSEVEVHEYMEIVQLPRQSQPQTPTMPPNMPQGIMQAGPLTVEPIPENLPPDHPTWDEARPPMAGGSGPNVMAGRESEVPPALKPADLAYEVPEGWTEQAGSGMRMAQFLPDAENPAALVTLIALSGAAGSMEANIARWRGQVGLDPAKAVEIQHVDGHMHYEYISFLAESASLQQPQTIIAAIYQQPGRTLFLKFMGPTEMVEKHERKFKALASSLKQQEGAE